MRYAAAVMTALVFAASGIRMTLLGSERVRLLEQSLLLLVTVRNRLAYYREPVGELIENLCKTDGLGALVFLERCRGLEGEGMPFGEAWRSAVLESGLSPPLKRGDMEQLLSIGAAVGSTGLDGQLEKLALYGETLGAAIARARAEADRNGRIYAGLGVSAGIIAGLMIM